MPEDPTSDEATGLPTLEELGSDPTMLCLAWAGGSGVVASPHSEEPLAVRYLHLRGLVVGPSGDPLDVEWAQIHVAVPAEHAVDVAAMLARGATDPHG